MHSKGLFSSWTEEIWPFKNASLVKLLRQTPHSNDLFPSWMHEMCFLRLCLLENLALQTSCSKGLFFSWTEAMCFFILPLSANLTLQTVHVYIGLFCFVNWCKVYVQILCLYILSVTRVAFKEILVLVGSFHMSIQILFLG